MTDLDEFQLIRPLGRGGMGVVYLAQDTVLDRRVAIKLIGTSDPDATSRERFLMEARAIARLSHPNVVSIYRAGTTTDGRPYLVQELVAGASLDKLPRPIAWRRVCELALGITRGLAAAHRRGILHRDIKPGNIMLDERGAVRILDFGLAKLSHEIQPAMPVTAARGDTSDDPDATKDPVRPNGIATAATLDGAAARSPRETAHSIAGALVGTPRYLAPELWRGGAATFQSDLYALGVMLFELLAGAPPFAQQDLDALELAVTTTDAPSVTSIVADLPAWLAAVIERCLAREPVRRWESADELAYAIEQGLAGGPPIPDGNPYRGLECFDASHRGVFFGRGADIEHIIDRLRTDAMVAVTGDSGIGKSSLCRAGVLPALSSGALDDRTWRAIHVVPGKRPFDVLVAALQPSESGTVAELVRSLVPAPEHGLVVFVDQCEELVTIADRDQADRAGALLGALAGGYPNVRVLVALRGDFLTRVAALPALAAALSRGLHLLRPLSATDVREAIMGPARLKGVTFESPALVDELADSVAGTPGALPLLQFALAELWTARDRDENMIKASSLAQLGGVAGALARHADRVVLALAAPEREAARRILLRLVTAEGTRTARPASELVDGSTAEAALESLVRGRLVSARDTTAVPIYELAHEALIASWTTLRAWIDDRAGHRALLERVATATAAWRTDGRRRDLLWSKRQLQAAALVTDLGEGEREFLDASKRHVTRARVLRASALATVPLVALATWLGVRANAQAERAREINHHMASARTLHRNGDIAATLAMRERTAAFAAFDERKRGDGEAAWVRARTATATARAAYRAAAARLELALAVDANHEHARAALAELLDAHASLAEAARDREGVTELVARLAVYSDDLAARWRAPAQLTVTSAPATSIVIHPVVDERGRATVGAPRARGAGMVTAELPAGSYVVVLTGEDGQEVRAPILLARVRHRALSVEVPPRSRVPEGFIYIPAGEFLIGSDQDDFFRRDFLSAAPMYETRSDAYLIGRHEVTFADWIAYLDALEPDERAKRIPATRGGARMIRLERDGDDWAFSMHIAETELRARRGELLRYPERDRRAAVAWERLPVSGINLADAKAYAAWLDKTRAVPGARLCTEREWERAARGADGRLFPHGTTVELDDANLDFTYGKKQLAYGPDEVGAHPASNSPFGVADMLGNVWEWVEGEDLPQTRGGGWYYGPSSALPTNRDEGDAAMREPTTGLRLCANANPAR